ncbi:TIGR04388 family protein [Leptospira sp. WS92.C1]
MNVVQVQHNLLTEVESATRIHSARRFGETQRFTLYGSQNRITPKGTPKSSQSESNVAASISSPRNRSFVFGTVFVEKMASFVLLVAFFFTFVFPLSEFSSLWGQSVPQLNSARAFSSGELQPYVDAARLQSDQSSFMSTMTGGEQVIEASWEADVNAEIDAIVNSVTNSDPVNDVQVYRDAVRAQLELQKQQAKSQWLADAAAYVQTELQTFLNMLSQATASNVTSSNATAVNSIDPSVQAMSAASASQQVSPAQAAQSYYQGSQAWDNKWQDLLTKQAAWEQNSLNSIQNGLLQWDTAIAGLQNDKLAYLNGIEATKAQWLANKQMIENAENGVRGALQNAVHSIRSQEDQLRSSVAGDPILSDSFGDMDALLDSIQEALDQHSSLDSLASALGNFFQNQKNNADSKVAFWDVAKWQETYANETVSFSQVVGSSAISCVDHVGGACANQYQGTTAIQYQTDGSILGRLAHSGGTHLGNVSSYLSQGNYSSSARRVEDHYIAVCHAMDFSGTCWGGTGQYALDTTYCGNSPFAPISCGYHLDTVVDNDFTVRVNGNLNTQQITQNNNIRNAIFGGYDASFSLSSGAGLIAGATTPIVQETKVFLGGTVLDSSNWFSSLGSVNQVQVQTKYKYIDASMQGNQNFWSNLSSQFSNMANLFLSLVNPLKSWEERSAEYADEYDVKLEELELAKQTTSANYDSQISLMKSERDSWITDVYGFHIDGYEGSLENANSQYRAGQAAWSDEINLFQQVELNWYLSARDVLQAAVGDPTNGEQQFQTVAMAQASSLQTLIGNSESNTSYLYNTAVGLWDSYQYAASGNLIDQAIANQQSESSWNLQGAALSQSIADSFGRTEAYQTAQANAGLRINELITSLLGEPAEIVGNAELQALQNGALSAGQASSFWSNGNAAGFDFTGRAADNQSTIDEYSAVRADVTIASNLQSEMSDQEATFLNKAAEYFEKSERYLSLSATAESEGRFDEASYYMKLSADQKGIASKLLNKGYNALGDTISSEVDLRGLNFTKSSFLEYKDSLLHKNFKNSTEIAKHIQSEKNSASGILNSGKTYDEIQTMLQAAKNLIVQGNDNHTAIESLLSYSQELAQRDIGGSLLDGLEDLISSLGSQIPKDISNASVTQAVANSQKEMEEKQSGVNELLHHMNSLVTNNNDLQALQALLQGGSQSMNLAANTAIAQYLDETTRKIQKENAERSANLQKELFDSLLTGDAYKYLRDAGYEFRVSGDSISGYRQIQSGDIAIDGNAMKAESYSPVLEFQYLEIATRFDPGNLSTAMLGDLNSTSFSANLVQNVRDSLSSMQEQMEKMFSEFQDKTAELQTLHAYNQQIQEYQENQFKEIKKNVVAAFQGLEPGFQKNFKPAMSGMKEYHTEASRYSFEEGSFGSQSSAMRSAFDGIRNAGGVYNGSRELKGSVNIKGIPVEVSYGMQDLLILSNFELGALDYDFNLKGTGTSFAQEQLTTINVKYQTYVQDVQQRIEDQAKANDAEKESKGFIFTIMNGMNTGSGSMSERFTQSVQGELQSRVTGAVAEATGLPASFVGALVGGSSMKDAFQAFQKQTITSEISKATGIPEWVISGQMDKMNKPKEEFYETQEFQMAMSVVAVVAAPFTFGSSMLMMAAIGAAQGAAEGGLKGALVGAVGGAISSYTKAVGVSVNLSYSEENGFGASVAVGIGPAAVSVGVSEHGGATISAGLQYGGVNAGVSYNTKTKDLSGNIGLSSQNGTNMALSYSQQSGFGVNVGYNHSSGVGANVGWSEHDGLGGGLSYGKPVKEGGGIENRWAGTGANVNWSEYGKTTVNLTAGAGSGHPGMNNVSKFGSGGVTAGTWTQGSGMSMNTNFLNDKFMQDYLGAQEEERQNQHKENNKNMGADVLAGAGIEVAGRKPEDGTDLSNGTQKPNGEPADPVDQRIAQLKKELSEGISLAHDNGTMSDAGNPVLANAAKELSSKMNELNRLLASKEAGGSKHQVGQGENPAKIAEKMGIPVEQLYAANPGMKERYEKVGWLYKGESINIPGNGQDSNLLGNLYGKAKSGATELYGKTASVFGSVVDVTKGLWDRAFGSSKRPGTFEGSDGKLYSISDGNSNYEKMLEITDRNGNLILDQNGKPVNPFPIWSGEGPLKQFEIVNTGRHDTFVGPEGYSLSQPLEGRHVVTDIVHGNENSANYPDTDFHKNQPYHKGGHLGTDLIPGNSSNVSLYAAEGGSIVSIDPNTNGIRIKADSGYTLNYLHSSGFSEGIYPGARVEAGQIIGRLGGASNSRPNGYGPHLHFQVRDASGNLLTTDKVFDRYNIR